MSHSIKGLTDIEKYCSTIFFIFKGIQYTIYNSMDLLNCSVPLSKAKLVVWDNMVVLQDG